MLGLAFSPHSGDIELTCDVGSAAALQRLRTRFSSAATVSHISINVGVDDFLLNLQELGTWPDGNLSWQPEVLALVEGNYSDTLVIQDRLASGPGETVEYGVPPGLPWAAPLTGFQRRDL